ncbi:zinc-binding protein A33-like [Eucyclogobius newberryi]|uniref:zinc-binding protein A33-like n=1 Tax=Eucyclogobius newberryi TaxID=166745 RepID=UPI003B5990B2
MEDVFSEKDLLCPQCSGSYIYPLLLKCGHNICRLCLQTFWESKGCRECPVCGALSVPGRPPINLQLKIAAEEYQRQKAVTCPEVCGLHNEKLQVFCENDQEVICLVCQTSKSHRIHQCRPVEEAAEQKKKEITAKLEKFKKNLKVLNKRREKWEETKSFILTQTQQSEATIREEFEKLRVFLQVEEESRLTLLRQEGDVKRGVLSEKIQDIQNQIQTVAALVDDIEAALSQKDLQFLQNYKQIKKRTKDSIKEPMCVRDILIDSAKHVGILKCEVWKKMATIVKSAPITFDPNTAQSNLCFSDELTSVRYGGKRSVPDNPERCVNRVCVLGTPGFSSGRHTWTVDVGWGRDWYVGVARESIQRKTTGFLEPAEGFWVIGRTDGDSYWAQTPTRTRLVVKQKPERITMELDYGRGKVVFINNTDMTVMHTFKDKFTEKIFAFFSPGLYEEGKVSSPVTICAQTINVSMT